MRQKIAVNGNPYLFDEKFGLSSQTVNVFKSITLDNYLDFRRRYMVISQEEYEKYNELQSLRTLESCQLELEALQKFYALYQKEIMSDFDRAFVADHDPFFDLKAQQEFYGAKLRLIPDAKHHVFFRFNSFRDILNQS